MIVEFIAISALVARVTYFGEKYPHVLSTLIFWMHPTVQERYEISFGVSFIFEQMKPCIFLHAQRVYYNISCIKEWIQFCPAPPAYTAAGDEKKQSPVFRFTASQIDRNCTAVQFTLWEINVDAAKEFHLKLTDTCFVPG